MKFIVTGSSGFIGTNLVESLLKSKIDVLGVDIAEPINKSHNSIFVSCDIRDRIALQKIFHEFKPDYVLHMAARTDLNGKTLDDYNSNTLGVENICQICSTLDNFKKVIFASSMLVCENGYSPLNNLDFKPSTIYGESKVIGEKIVRDWDVKLPNFVIVRPTSIWGPWFKTPYRDFFDLVLSGKFVDIGPNLSKKTYGYVENAVQQILSLSLSDKDLREEMIYLGDVEPIDIRQWAFDISNKSEIKPPRRVPFFIISSLAVVGDIFKKFNISFPMTSFRLRNMTTKNIIDCKIANNENIYNPIDYDMAIDKTLKWMKTSKVK